MLASRCSRWVEPRKDAYRYAVDNLAYVESRPAVKETPEQVVQNRQTHGEEWESPKDSLRSLGECCESTERQQVGRYE
mgnify:FL=1